MIKTAMIKKLLLTTLTTFSQQFHNSCRQTGSKTSKWQKLFDCSSALLKNFYVKGDRENFYLKHVSEEFIKELSHLKSYNLYTVLKNNEPLHVKHGKFIIVP